MQIQNATATIIYSLMQNADTKCHCHCHMFIDAKCRYKMPLPHESDKQVKKLYILQIPKTLQFSIRNTTILKNATKKCHSHREDGGDELTEGRR
jgi:hypothetical protein